MAGVSALAAAVAAGCGSAGGGAKTVAGVASCLQSAGYGVTVVPTSQIASAGPENRGPGQTGELLVGRRGARPAVGSDNADAAVALWKSAKLAKSSPNAKATTLSMHAYAIGSITVQPTTHLFLYVIKANKTEAARKAAFDAQLTKIEACVR